MSWIGTLGNFYKMTEVENAKPSLFGSKPSRKPRKKTISILFFNTGGEANKH